MLDAFEVSEDCFQILIFAEDWNNVKTYSIWIIFYIIKDKFYLNLVINNKIL